MERYQEIERSIITRYRKPLWKKFINGVNDYKLIEEGDKIGVCISGGKDSMLLAKLMQEVQRHGKIPFEMEFIVMDPGYNEINRQTIINNAKLLNIPIDIFDTQIYDIVAGVDESPCYLCARMRRGYLYKRAQALGCNKIALGHHFDDVIETILMGMLYGGQIQTMMPKLHSTNHPGMQLIRPMYLVKEADILNWKNYHELQFIQCACRLTENCTLCDNGGGGSKRQEMKGLIKRFRQTNPSIDMNIFRSVHDVNLSTIIGYHDKTMTYNFLDDYDQKGAPKC
ncbi:MAG: PP-loop domain protein [Herbinix sp.]|jgi:tRNA(Ile)-lysidine synthase TilS/MesJ|nr:PP-loop domain protein [Herbinix sp.]